jgi:hypothetical protein
MCIDLTINHTQWYNCGDINITSPGTEQIVQDQINQISVTLHSQSGAQGHANLYVGTPGSGPNPCIINPTPLILTGSQNNQLPTIGVPSGGTDAPDPSSAMLPSTFFPAAGWPSPVMIVAKTVVDEGGACQVGENPGWNASDGTNTIGARRFAVVPQAMFKKNMTVLLQHDDPTHTAYAMMLHAPNAEVSRTILRAVVIGSEKRVKHIDPESSLIIQDYERGSRWTPAGSFRLALGKERLLLDGPRRTDHPRLGQVGPLAPATMRRLVAGSDWQSERDIAIELRMSRGEVRQALLELPLPPPGEYHVVKVWHQVVDTGQILHESSIIVEGDRFAVSKAA